ncbi:restriction endonuclease subunit S [Aeromonas caviae]|uniref:restriction endonuclease subunit S n=1 Tax=Aeromonas TaxID=642 RepID=UPI0019084F10|nr:MULTISPECIES: restriction endonuclease subunit S [Aeromonas]MBP4060273.1 restriction endonuclease subunit S [Aeromonas sp. Prich7-2]QQM74574.1 restriction endonuclease subunit S [Aeromonas caviae]QQV19690.1 restriction endonuclease subunit S [Aeromonas caviae]
MKAGWAKTTIGATFTTVTGGTPSKSNEGFYGDFIPLVKPPELRGSELDSAEDGLSEAGAAVARIAPRHSILVSCIGNLGKVGLNTIPVAFNQQINAIFPDGDKALPSFMLYQVLSCSFKEQLESQASGTTVPIVNKSKFNSIEIVLPPLSEQQRIVAILDEAFEAIAAARANAEQNRQNSRALFESYLQSVFSQRGKGWVDTTIGADVKFIDYRGKTPVKTECGVRLITAKNVKMGYIQETPMEFIASEGYSNWMTRGIPKKGDVLFTTEAPLANVAQLDTDEPVAFAQRVIIMQPNATKLNSTFLKYLLLSQPIQQRIRTKGTGATVQGIKASLLKQIDISFPPSLSEQQQIVEQLDSLRDKTLRLESLYQRKIAALDELRQSLLQQAFSGQL